MKQKHLLLVFILVIFDQITKTVISSTMNLWQSISVIENFFSITYVQNTGAAWSMLEGNMLFFYMITIVAIVIMVTFYKSGECDAISEWGIALMLGGTLGNFLDRIRLQYVVDFLDFIIFGYDFPVFNVADICLCVGVGVLILSFVLESVREKKSQ
jgi:signal peptidase II